MIDPSSALAQQLAATEHICIACGRVFTGRHWVLQHIDEYGDPESDAVICSALCGRVGWGTLRARSLLPGLSDDATITILDQAAPV